jgi:hypothetical protein
MEEDATKGLARGSVTHGIYGGVQFGLDKFSLFGPARIPKKPPPRRAVAGLPPVSHMLGATSPFLPPVRSLALPLASGLSIPVGARSVPMMPRATIQAMMAPRAGMGLQPDGTKPLGTSTEEAARQGMAWSLKVLTDKGLIAPGTGYPSLTGETAASIEAKAKAPPEPEVKGVDLRLDDFDLKGVTKVSMQKPAALKKCLSLGSAFWAGLDDDSTVFEAEDKDLLKSIFNERLSDRRSEGDKFVPVDASISYVSKLRDLVKEETNVRQRRKEQFFGKEFSAARPGNTFPSSWNAAVEVSRGKAQIDTSDGQTRTLQRRKDYEKEVELSDQVLKSVTPIFDKQTEEGAHFRIYRVGNLEFRSTQEINSKEEVGAVYSINSTSQIARPRTASKKNNVTDNEKITKVTEYVEKAVNGASTLYHHFYLVLETDRKNRVLTELLPNGNIQWLENDNFDARNSMAKVFHYAEGSNRATIGQVRALRNNAMQEATQHGFSKASSKQYARCLGKRARTSGR